MDLDAVVVDGSRHLRYACPDVAVFRRVGQKARPVDQRLARPSQRPNRTPLFSEPACVHPI